MNIKVLIKNIFIVSFSFLLGIAICEFFGRIIGLGNPILYEADRLIGYRLKANQNIKRFNNSEITTDYEGFRIDPQIIDDSKKEIIVFVGDSVTYGGSYIDNSELFSNLYCLKNSQFLCLNSGLNGWGTYNMGRFIYNFSIYSERIPSKFVLVILPGDDQRGIAQLETLPYWTSSPRYPRAINELINYSIWRYKSFFLGGNSINERKNNFEKSEIKSRTIKHSWVDLYNYIKYSEAGVDIIITPPKYWFENSEKFQSEISLYDNYLLEISKNPKVLKTCNLYHKIKNDFNSDDYFDSVHLSKTGHEKWAKTIDLCLK